jgi:hypothetical protein
MLLKSGSIDDLILQPKYLLQEAFTSNEGQKIKPIYYVADFQYRDRNTGETIVEDVKGHRTKDFELKMKMFLKRYQQYKYLLT